MIEHLKDSRVSGVGALDCRKRWPKSDISKLLDISEVIGIG